MRNTFAVLASFTAFALFTPFIVVTQKPPGQAPTFRSRVDLVQVDVSVLDKDRQPVRGLTSADFTVLEDGKPQQITIFEPVDVPDPEPPPVEWMRDVTPDVTTNETRVSRLFVIVVDDVLIPTDPWIIKSSRKIVEDIIAKFGPDDLAAIVFTGDSRKSQDFTNDHAKLLATLDKYNPGLAAWIGAGKMSGVDADAHFKIGVAATLLNVMDTLIQIPHSRKALIWVTPGVPTKFDYALPTAYDPKDPSQTVADRDAHLRLIELTKDLFDIARRANVPVYPIDPCGLSGLQFYLYANRKDTGLAEPAMDYIMMTAANTGGHAIVNTNDFTPGINSIFQENGSYYLIGYNPTNTNTDGTLRRIDVKVNRPDVDVRTKSGYVAPKPGDAAPTTVNGTLAKAVAEPVPVRDLPLRATVAPFAIPGGRNAAVVIALGVRQPVPESAATGRVTVTTELRTSAYTTEGDLRGSQRHTAKVVLRAGAQGDADYEALSRIDLPPGRYRLRLAAYHAAAGKTGTVQVDVVVPDFNRDAASMSGVVLGATPGRPSAPRDLFRDILPLVPTAQRSFVAKDQVTALFDLYQNAGQTMVPAQVAIRIVDGVGAALITDSRTIGIDRFVAAQTQKEAPAAAPVIGGTKSIPTISLQPRSVGSSPVRAAEFQYRVPLERLPAGRYLLTFEATIGAVVLRRDVQFDVRSQ